MVIFTIKLKRWEGLDISKRNNLLGYGHAYLRWGGRITPRMQEKEGRGDDVSRWGMLCYLLGLGARMQWWSSLLFFD